MWTPPAEQPSSPLSCALFGSSSPNDISVELVVWSPDGAAVRGRSSNVPELFVTKTARCQLSGSAVVRALKNSVDPSARSELTSESGTSACTAAGCSPGAAMDQRVRSPPGCCAEK